MIAPIRTGLASFGMSGLVFHGPLLHSSDKYNICGILERTKELSRQKYPESRLFRTFEEMISDEEIELIVVNTPDRFHFEQCLAALEAGKNVVVEKPFTQEFSQAEVLINLAKQKGLVLSVFQNRRWDGDFMTVKKVLDEGLLGRLVSFESHFDRYRNFIQKNTWKEEEDSGSGIVYNLGSHMIDQALVLFGRPLSVSADIRTLRSGGKVDDFFDIRLDYRNDLNVRVTGSLLVKEPGPRYICHGTEGSFLKWGTDPQEQDLKEGKCPGIKDWGIEKSEIYGLLNSVIHGKELYERIQTLPGNYMAFYEQLYEAIRNKVRVPVNPEDAAIVVKIINAAFRSNLEKRSVSI
jgi:scyllo-inositol 2-dehydrogenase (NADP+)